MPSFAVPSTAVSGREPERAEQVSFVGDTPWRHDNCRDRVVDDFLLCAERNTAALAAATQLSNQLGTALVQLVRGLLTRPSGLALPGPDDASHARPEPKSRQPPSACRKLLIHE
jgi:hypothetical protein